MKTFWISFLTKHSNTPWCFWQDSIIYQTKGKWTIHLHNMQNLKNIIKMSHVLLCDFFLGHLKMVSYKNEIKVHPLPHLQWENLTQSSAWQSHWTTLFPMGMVVTWAWPHGVLGRQLIQLNDFHVIMTNRVWSLEIRYNNCVWWE